MKTLMRRRRECTVKLASHESRCEINGKNKTIDNSKAIEVCITKLWSSAESFKLFKSIITSLNTTIYDRYVDTSCLEDGISDILDRLGVFTDMHVVFLQNYRQ